MEAAPSRDASLPLIGVSALAATVRCLFLLQGQLPAYDPWRHLQLIENLRRGAGFTLFEGQPYIWYHPLWYFLCARAPAGIGAEWIAALASTLAVLLCVAWLRGEGLDARAATLAGALFAVFGPGVAYTCHLGPEALALLLSLGALALHARARAHAGALAAGLLFGLSVAARLNFVCLAPLFLPRLRRRPARAVAFACGAALPLAHAWWRNHRAIASHPFLFTWDGLATRTADFDLVSTLALQRHPALAEALHRLHERVIPLPEWWVTPRGTPAWGLLAFMLVALVCVAAARRPAWWACTAVGLCLFLLVDRTGSSHYFRIYLPLFPLLLAAIAAGAVKLWRDGRWPARLAGVALVALALAGGGRRLIATPMVPLDKVTPPAALLAGETYMVSSGFYHPESLIVRFPDKRFIGLPLDPAQLDELRAAYPEFRAVLWHEFTIQPELYRQIAEGGGYRLTAEAANAYGHTYRIFEPVTADP